jgi:nucleotide-binding universal stress UspA family protein
MDERQTSARESHKSSLERPHPLEIAIRNILMATDFSNCSDRALRYALGIAQRYGATLHLFHWIDPAVYLCAGPGAIQAARDACRRDIQGLDTELHAKGLFGNIRDHVLVEDGELFEILPRVTSEQAIDLIVIGTHGRTGWNKLILGSVAERIFRQAPCPVLTVGPCVTQSQLESGGPHDILLPVDFSSECEAAAPFAFSLAEKYGSRLTLLHVLKHGSEKTQDQTKTRLRDLAEFHEAAMDRTALLVTIGPPADSILGVALEKKADLIVLGVRAHQSLSDRLTWPNAYRIVCDSPCPVLTARTAGPPAG